MKCNETEQMPKTILAVIPGSRSTSAKGFARMPPMRKISQRRLVAYRHAYHAVEEALEAYEALRDDIYADVKRGISVESGPLTVHICGRGIVVNGWLAGGRTKQC